ncbi:MAG: hypothetical protein QOH92_180 [Chloroflexota bacterium]|jgi:hypothetical protein|nr:hypothetical protein [Chloroflexota bacterium]
MPEPLNERDWDTLITNIRAHECLPFLGAGASAPALPLGWQLAKDWARRHGYPLQDSQDLARVAQFITVDRGDSKLPKQWVAQQLAVAKPPDFHSPGEPHGVLADLPLPIYMTTNYDDFMVRALKSRSRAPYREVCQWNDDVKAAVGFTSVFETADGWAPQPEKPVVFHLHGHTGMLDSMVLTEDDYFDFLINVGDPKLLPPKIKEALTSWSLLFIGYSLTDWSFRVIHRALVAQRRRTSRRFNVTVQLGRKQDTQAARDYLAKYYQWMNVRVYWGEARDFLQQLADQWHRSLVPVD